MGKVLCVKSVALRRKVQPFIIRRPNNAKLISVKNTVE